MLRRLFSIFADAVQSKIGALLSPLFRRMAWTKVGMDGLAPRLAPVIKVMADTGIGTDECLKQGCLPVPIHFYSPVPDLDDLATRGVWNRMSSLAGIDFSPDAQLVLLKDLGQAYGKECAWPATKVGEGPGFYTENQGFSFGCAASTHCMIRHCRPRRIIEIGSGSSSLVISESLRMNSSDADRAEYTIIDPFPGEYARPGKLACLTEVIEQKVETVAPAFFDRLKDGDILFVDSGHTVRIGSDVNFLILDVLPRLHPGVIVHFHDINLPYEYPEVYATNPSFRQFWTEAYLLQAFLIGNRDFEILLAMSYLMRNHADVFRLAFPKYDENTHKLQSGSFWIRKISKGERASFSRLPRDHSAGGPNVNG